jgi:hypothetical protein
LYPPPKNKNQQPDKIRILCCLSFDWWLLIILYGIFWPLCCLSFFDLWLLVILYGIFWPLCCLSFDLWLLIIQEGQTTQWPKDTIEDNQKPSIKGQTTQWPKDTIDDNQKPCGYKCIKYNWPVKLSTFIATIF